MSPYKALFGIYPPIHLPYVPSGSHIATVEDLFAKREPMIVMLKQSLHKEAFNRMK